MSGTCGSKAAHVQPNLGPQNIEHLSTRKSDIFSTVHIQKKKKLPNVKLKCTQNRR